MSKLNRRDFIKTTSLAGAGATVAPSTIPGFLSRKDDRKIRLGFIGTGLRGRNHLDLALRRKDCEVTAICDIDPAAITHSLKMISDYGRNKPKVFSKGEEDYLNLLKESNIDAVVISTPWIWHVPMAVHAMKAGKYTAMEVSGAMAIEECWDLVRTSEETKVPLMFLENVCYRRDVMAVLNMVRKGMFGEMIHLEGGYQHDLRHVKFNDGVNPYGGGVEFNEKGFSEAKWRTNHSVYRDGDLYPTHGIGPVAMYCDINRGNRFLYLTAMSTKARGLQDYVVNHPKGGKNHPNAEVEFKLGDVVTTLIKTQNGESILLSHDTNLPRPYSLGFRVQGTKGIWMDVNQSLYLEGVSEQAHRWESADSYLKEYDHPLWKKYEKDATGAGHGGMDFFVFNAFVECVKRKIDPPIDVYDAATWMAITPLSEQSIANGGQPMHFPDFTKGRWMHRKNDFALSDDY